jgi:SH3-like domain-containing protein
MNRCAPGRFQAEWKPVGRPESALVQRSGARSDAKPLHTFAERALRVALALALALTLVQAASREAQAQPRIGPDSQLPVPRYVALRGSGVNGRRGPGPEHRIEWIYQRAGLPLLVTAESGPWRRVRDPGGAEVWIHSVHLEDRRTVYVLGGRLGTAALRRSPRAKARVVAYLERGVVARLEACRGEWRRLAVEDREGWVEVAALWGAESCAAAAGNS